MSTKRKMPGLKLPKSPPSVVNFRNWKKETKMTVPLKTEHQLFQEAIELGAKYLQERDEARQTVEKQTLWRINLEIELQTYIDAMREIKVMLEKLLELRNE